MNETLRRLQIVLRSQLMVGRVHARNWTRSALLLAVALVFFVAAIAVLDVSAFLFFYGRLGAIQAGLLVGAANLLIGGVLLWLAFRQPGESEEMKLAQELSEVSLDALSRDVSAARDELRAFSRDVRRIQSAVHLVTTALGAPLSLLIRLLSEGTDQGEEGEDGAREAGLDQA